MLRSTGTLVVLAAWCLSLPLPGGEAMPAMFRQSPSNAWRAAVAINPALRSERPVSRWLYGKFAEHLGSNIYNGMWSQIVRNPGFEPARFYGGGGRLARRAEHIERRMGVRGLAAGLRAGVAFLWVPFGQGETRFALDGYGFHSETCQRVEVTSVPKGSLAGIAQPLCLPAHRVLTYELSFVAREKAGTPSLLVQVRHKTPDGTVLASHVVRGLGQTWRRHEAALSVPKGRLQPGDTVFLVFALQSTGIVWLDEVQLFPTDHVDGWDPDVVRLWREAKLPLLRYPGGNFVSGYHWQDGVGPREKRPTRLNRPWNQPEPNHVGTDEFIAFCRAVGCEPMICVNAGDGTPEEAAAWVEYCNGGPDTRFGRLRAENGHPKPHNVRVWEMGNELYGRWQIGHCSPEQYAERYERFYRAVKAADPSIHVVANGQDLRWNKPLVTRKGAIVHSVSQHTLIGGGLRESRDAVGVFQSLMAYPTAYAGVLEGLRRQMAPHAKRPRIAVTELQLFTNVPHLPNNCTVAEALFLAGTIHTAVRAGDLVEMITHSATVNHAGGLHKVREIVYPDPVYHTSKLYATQPGTHPIGIHVTTPVTDVPARRGLPAVKGSPTLDAIALAAEDGKAIVLLAVNRHQDKPLPLTISVQGWTLAPKVRQQVINGGMFGHNTWEHRDRILLRERTLTLDPAAPSVVLSPCSVNALTLRRAQ